MAAAVQRMSAVTHASSGGGGGGGAAVTTAGATGAMAGSTSKGDWELRDGKYYRRDVVSISGPQQHHHTVQVQCPNCPTHLEKIRLLTIERDNLQKMVKERDAMIAQLKARLMKLESEAKGWMSERNRLMKVISDREKLIRELQERLRNMAPGGLLKEKEQIIMRLNSRIAELEKQLAQLQGLLKEKETLMLRIRELEALLSQRDAEIARLNDLVQELRARVKELSDLLIQCRASVREVHVAPCPPKEDMRWYYAVQDPCHAQLFQMHPRYLGGEITVDALEGATVVNPEYYTQSEQVPGSARLRVRVVEAQGVQGGPCTGCNMELFVRLRLGSATQFTHPRPISVPAISWQQDFVFVGVPLKHHPFHSCYQASMYPLIIEVVARTIGTAFEQVVGTGEVDLVDLVAGLTRVVFINLNGCCGVVNIRLKALDFGLPAGPAECPGPGRYIPPAPLPVPQPHRHQETVQHTTQVVRTTERVNVGSEEMARQLDMRDGVMDGRMGNAEINVRSDMGGRAQTSSHYNVSDPAAMHRLDMSDGVQDGKYKGTDIRLNR